MEQVHIPADPLTSGDATCQQHLVQPSLAYGNTMCGSAMHDENEGADMDCKLHSWGFSWEINCTLISIFKPPISPHFQVNNLVSQFIKIQWQSN